MSDKLAKSYWLSKYVKLPDENTVIPRGMDIVENLGVVGSKVDVLTNGAGQDDNVILMVYSSQKVEDALTASGLQFLGKDLMAINTRNLPVSDKKIKTSYPTLKDTDGLSKKL